MKETTEKQPVVEGKVPVKIILCPRCPSDAGSAFGLILPLILKQLWNTRRWNTCSQLCVGSWVTDMRPAVAMVSLQQANTTFSKQERVRTILQLYQLTLHLKNEYKRLAISKDLKSSLFYFSGATFDKKTMIMYYIILPCYKSLQL